MQKEKVFSALGCTMFSIAAFAIPPKESADSSSSIPYEQTPLLGIILIGVLAIIIICVVVFIIHDIYSKFSEHFKTLDGLKSSFSNLKNTQANLVSQSENKIYNATMQYLDQKSDQLYANINASISSAISSLSSNDLTVTLAKCAERTRDVETKLTSLLSLTPKILEMNEQMQKLIAGKPELVNLSINTAVELVRQCQAEGFCTASQIKEIAAVFNKCKELQFVSVSEIAESKKYYDARNAHAAAANESAQKISDLEEEKASLRQELSLLKQKQMSVAEESVRLKQANETLSAKNAELTHNFTQIDEERNRLSFAMKSLCPNEVNADSLIHLLKDTLPELRAETLALVVQLYWFAQLYRSTPNKIKAAFTKFDETLYELFSEEQELLQSIRQTIHAFINTEVFKGTSYKVTWPMLNSSASEHEDHYNRENDEGNRICKVRSAVIINAGNVESVARIYTSL